MSSVPEEESFFKLKLTNPQNVHKQLTVDTRQVACHAKSLPTHPPLHCTYCRTDSASTFLPALFIRQQVSCTFANIWQATV